jgi:prolyl oligopeptidase
MPFARNRWHTVVTTLLAFAAASSVAQTRPPAPPVRDVTDIHFGVAVPDPYRYFEDLKDPDVAGWIKAEGDYAKAVLAKLPGRATLLKEIQERGDAASARISSLQVVGAKVYYQKRLATDNIFKLYVRDGFGGKERLLVDPEAIESKEGEHYALDYYAPSPDNRFLAYGISPAGSEDSVLRVIDLATGKETGDVIDRAQFGSPSWLPDGGLLYTRLAKLPADAPAADKYQNQRVYVHRLGENPDGDTPLFGAGISSLAAIDPVEFVTVYNPLGSTYLLALAINGVQREFKLWVAPWAGMDGGKTPWLKVIDNADEVTDLAVHGDSLFVMTHKDAPRFKVLRTPLAKPDLPTAELVIAPGESVVNSIGAAKDGLYVRKMNGGNSELFRLSYALQAIPQVISLPFVGDIGNVAVDPRVPGAVFSLGGWTRFGGYYAYSPATGKTIDTRLQPQGRYDNPGTLEVTEVRAKAPDGMLIPLSIVRRKGVKLDGSNPTIVYGYGAYGIPETPFFRPTWLPWFDRGGVLAVAHVRGGGEYGDDWYKGGYKATKSNTWRDAIACAEWLVANKYTSPARMSINGGSAGGIFVGRAITERPDLFGAAVDQVPFSDTIRSEVSASGPSNAPEFGTIKTEEGFRSLYAMSPYLAVKDNVKYPAVLLTTGFNDPRVDTWDVAKMAARLMAASSSGKPILLRVDYDEGHGLGSTKKAQYEERADIFAFLLWQAGATGFQP